jgi:hypothetical protein
VRGSKKIRRPAGRSVSDKKYSANRFGRAPGQLSIERGSAVSSAALAWGEVLRQVNFAIVCAIVLSATGSAHAWNGPVKKLKLDPPLAQPALTRDQLRTCMMSADFIVAQRSYLEEPAEKLKKTRRELVVKADRLARIRKGLDWSVQEDVDAYNLKVVEYTREQHWFNNSVDLHNAERDRFIHAYKAECAGKPYVKTEEEVLRAELWLEENPIMKLRSDRH